MCKRALRGGGVNIIDFTSGNNTVNTGGGANTITGTSGHNYIKTGAGVDTITLGGGDNIINFLLLYTTDGCDAEETVALSCLHKITKNSVYPTSASILSAYRKPY